MDNNHRKQGNQSVDRPHRPRSLGALLACMTTLCWLGSGLCIADGPTPPTTSGASHAATAKWQEIKDFFVVPEAYQGKLGEYRSLLTFDKNGAQPPRQVASPEDWALRRQEIRLYWQSVMGPWPELLECPRMNILASEQVGSYTRHTVEIEVATGRFVGPEYLLVPDGDGPFPAVLVTWYNSADAAGITEKLLGTRDFGAQLAERGYVTLCLGSTNGEDVRQPTLHESIQPLAYLAYTAANAGNMLASLPYVQPERIGITGHSYGGKWAMYASCLHEKFACAVWGDPGIVWNESDPSANYWDPWYLGQDFTRPPDQQRRQGLVSDSNPRTGAYRRLVAEQRDMHELHALMAPRPFLVSGGGQDRPEHWIALNHSIAINRLLGYTDRVAMTIREGHAPTPAAIEQAFNFLDYYLQHAP